MKFISQEIGRTKEGNKIVRNYFVHEKGVNVLGKSQSLFRKEDKKMAKEKYKLAKKHQSTEHTRLRQYTIGVLTGLHKTKFDCGNLVISLLK